MNLRALLSTLTALAATALAPVAQAGTADAADATDATHATTPGTGWYLTVIDRGPAAEYGGIQTRSQRLVLVSPTGETHTVLDRPASRRYGGFLLSDWSPDGSTALLESTGRSGTVAIRVDLATGTATELPLAGQIATISLSPDGGGVFVERFKHGSSPFVIERVSWSGVVTQLSPASQGPLLAGPGNTLVTTGANTRELQVIDAATGAVLNHHRSRPSCVPIRWWDTSRVLATCGNDLALIDPATGARTALTSQHGPQDYGHFDAREIESGLYVQVAGACGTTFVSHQAADGSMHMLHVPGAVGNVVMVDGVGRNLVIEHAADCDGGNPRSELSLYNPVTRHEHVLVALGRHQVFDRIMVYGEVRASSY